MLLSRSTIGVILVALTASAFAVFVPAPSFAFQEKERAAAGSASPVAAASGTAPAPASPTNPLSGLPIAALEFFRPELAITTSNFPASDAASSLSLRGPEWTRLLTIAGPSAQIYLDPRSGTPTNILAAIPMIPGDGDGNTLTLDALNASLGRRGTAVDSPLVAEVVRRFVAQHAAAMAVDDTQLGPVRAALVTPEMWHIRIPQRVNGVPVRYAHLSATISHGNMVLLGTELWGNARIDTEPAISAARALDLGFAYVGGQTTGDKIWQQPRLEIVPFAPPQHQTGSAFTGPLGKGYGHYLVWSFGFQRGSEIENWEVLVDAQSGAILSLEDQNHYESQPMKGGVYPLTSTDICPNNMTCGTMQPGQPMPFANTGLPAPNNFTNSAGVYDWPGGTVTTTLNGRFVRMTDTCGAISESTTTGPLDLGGVNGQHDCVSGGQSGGNTPASRSGFYELNKLIEVAKGWLPANAWLDGQLVANMNLTQTCNAFYQPSNGQISFYRSGGGCRNTGELAAVFDHEWGHAMDDNDSGGVLSNSSEAYADIAAIYRLRTSCVGHGFFWTVNDLCGMTADGTGFNVNESQTGSYCTTNCSGVRDSDWAGHVSNEPATALGFVCTHCAGGTGPCGRQTHCSAAPSRQAAWDLVTRDLTAAPFNMSREDAFNLGSKIYFQGSGNIGSWNTCSCGVSSDGCGATNAYPLWLAADDDDGNITNGTPHMTAIFAAFNRHGIACATPTPVNSGCANAPATAPVVTLTASDNQVDVAWTPVAGASTYRVMRTEGHAGCDLGKAVIAEVTGTSFTDSAVANSRPYYYVVQAVGTSGACMGPGSACAVAVPVPCAGSPGTDRSTYNCTDLIHLRLTDADLVGDGTHTIAITSPIETTPEIVTLVEAPPNSGRFHGTIATSVQTPAPNGIISVADRSSVTLTYLDALSCGVPNVTMQRTAAIDCTGQPCRGTLTLDHPIYTCADAIHITLVDSDLAASGSRVVAISSDAEPVPEQVTLLESPPGSGIFAGSIQATSAPAAADGLLSAVHGGTVTASYQDASACGIPNTTIQRVAAFDCASPVISNVRVEGVTGSTAIVRWDTDEPSTSFVTYGPAAPPATTTPVNPALVTAHSVTLTGLPDCGPQFYSVGSADAFAQTTVDANGGAFRTFTMGVDVPATFNSQNVPVTLPTVSPYTATATIDIADPRKIIDVNVHFNMSHTFVGLVTLYVLHPDGTLVFLSNRRGGTGDHFIETVFDDEAATPISSATAPFTGSFRPDGLLSSLDGKGIAGQWKVVAFDDVSGAGGLITDVDLLLTVTQACGPRATEETSARLTESCAAGGSGHGNGFWDAGETGVVRVTLRNSGQVTLTNVSARLAPVTAGVSMIDDYSTYPDLPRDAVADSTAPHFVAHLPAGIACGAPLSFDVAIHTNQGNYTDTIQLGTAGRGIPSGSATTMFQNFSGGIPGTWAVDDNGDGGGTANTWSIANVGGRTAISPISAPFIIVDSQAAGAGAEQDARLLTEVMDLSNALTVTLEFDSFFSNNPAGNIERGDVEVTSTATGDQLVNVHRYTNSSSANPDHRVVNITSQAAGASNVQLHFRYDGGPLDNWWMVDNVRVTHTFGPSCMMVTCPVTTTPSEVLHLDWGSRTSALWTTAAGASSYTLYRGVGADLPELFSAATDSCARLTTTSTTAGGFTENPPPGTFYWWIVRAANSFGLGTAGSGTAGARTHDSSGGCP